MLGCLSRASRANGNNNGATWYLKHSSELGDKRMRESNNNKRSKSAKIKLLGCLPSEREREQMYANTHTASRSKWIESAYEGFDRRSSKFFLTPLGFKSLPVPGDKMKMKKVRNERSRATKTRKGEINDSIISCAFKTQSESQFGEQTNHQRRQPAHFDRHQPC